MSFHSLQTDESPDGLVRRHRPDADMLRITGGATPEELAETPLFTPSGQQVRLGDLVRLSTVLGPPEIPVPTISTRAVNRYWFGISSSCFWG